MAVVPVIPMREQRTKLHGLEIRVLKYACPDSGQWVEYLQMRRAGQSWGAPALLETVA